MAFDGDTLKKNTSRAPEENLIRTQANVSAGAVSEQSAPLRRSLVRPLSKKLRRRLVRYSILTANLVLVAGVAAFVLKTSGTSTTVNQNAVSLGDAEASVVAIDELSSADIAVQVARLTNMYQTASVINNADSLNSRVAISTADQAIVVKPQIADTATKSRKDIIYYVTQDGDSVSSLASKFGVTSESIRWSNNLTSNTLPVGKELYIPPRNGIVYLVREGDTPDSLATRYRANKDQIVAFNDAEVAGLTIGDRILIPDGSIPAPAVQSYSGFSFGTSAIYGFNGYDYGWCTWYAANRRAALGNPVPSNLGNASTWYILAQRAGLPTGSTPAVGAVAVNQAGNHVSVVEQVNEDGSFWISEMNSRGQVSITDPTPAGGWNRLDYKLIPSVGNLKFVY